MHKFSSFVTTAKLVRLMLSEKLADPTRRLLLRHREIKGPEDLGKGISIGTRVLVLGIYLADRPNSVEHLVDAFSASRHFQVTQKWIGLLGQPPSAAVRAVTDQIILEPRPRSPLLNVLLSGVAWRDYDFVVISDDDIVVPKGFLDALLRYQIKFDFALAQAARTPTSYVDHSINRQCLDTVARRTRFVEIGPLMSVRRDFASDILPLDEASPMGWGLDLAWPVLAEKRGLRMGIIDAAAVDHSMRKPRAGYSAEEAWQSMLDYLETVPHLTHKEAKVVLESYAK